jgi:hypothetical protein
MSTPNVKRYDLKTGPRGKDIFRDETGCFVAYTDYEQQAANWTDREKQLLTLGDALCRLLQDRMSGEKKPVIEKGIIDNWIAVRTPLARAATSQEADKKDKY